LAAARDVYACRFPAKIDCGSGNYHPICALRHRLQFNQSRGHRVSATRHEHKHMLTELAIRVSRP